MIRANQMLLGALTRKAASSSPGKMALVYNDVRLTYRELNQRINRLAHGIDSLGINRGDRVAILQHNCFQYAEIYFALAKLGAITVPINFRYVHQEIEFILRDSEAETLIVGGSYLNKVQKICDHNPFVKNLICIGPPEDGSLNYEELINNSTPEEVDRELDDDDVVFLMYTAGTTGKPKGVMLTHRNILSSVSAQVICRRLTSEDTFLISAPLFHSAAACSLIATIYGQATNVILDHFEPALVMEAIEKEKITITGMVPTMLNQLLNSQDLLNKYDLSSMESITYGAAPMPYDVIKKAMTEFGWNFMQGYGMTEISPAYVSFLGPEDHTLDGSSRRETILSSVGKPGINAEIRIVGNQDMDVPTGTTGEILIRGQHVMKGYWRNPEETAEALRGGWFHTGDLGYMDEEGYLYLVGRKKDLIISGGENIYPMEVEEALYSHPSVLEAAVIGVSDKKWGETVKAIVALKPGMTATEAGMIDHCRSHLASYKKPTSVEFIDALPRNAAGKIMKIVLKDKYGSVNPAP